MKKMIVAAVVAAMAAGAALADRDAATLRAEAKVAYTNKTYSAFLAAMTTNEWRAVADDVLADAATNHYAGTPGRFWNVPSMSSSPLAAEYDQRFADAGIGVFSLTASELYPKTVEAWIAAPTNAAEVAARPVAIALMRKYGRINWWRDFSAPELANFAPEMCFLDPRSMHKVGDRVLGYIQKRIKRMMREKGLSFVVKDGVNPVQEEVDALSAAFNAPRHAGVKEWFAKWYPEYTWIESVQMTDAEVSKLKDDVLYGDKNFDARAQATLRFYLGVTAYNAFVKQYNGEE